MNKSSAFGKSNRLGSCSIEHEVANYMSQIYDKWSVMHFNCAGTVNGRYEYHQFQDSFRTIELDHAL